MSNYRVINDNGYERTWEELYEDNVSFQKYTDKLEKENKQLKERINKVLNKIDNMFDRGDANTIIDDLLELDKILKGSDSNGNN